jgi:pimeloyl-ACP methyl ester carboxylesterase
MDAHAQIVAMPDGRRLCFAEWGLLDGIPILSMHGTPGCRLLDARRIERRFEDLLAGLGIRLVTYDRPGYGRSDRQRGRKVADTAGDVAAIADALEVERFAVVGGSSGSAHALAVAALLPRRVLRVACVAPMAPYDQLGHEEWSRSQFDGVREYVAACLQGEETAAEAIAEEDAEMRQAAEGDQNQADVIEQTRNGVWGWVDDELAVLSSWGFDCRDVDAPTALWYDPNEKVLPAQHSRWLADALPNATLVTTNALGHGSAGDPVPDWNRLYKWLVDGR